MFNEMLGDMQKKQAEVQNALAEIKIVHDIEDGAITIELNANKEILNINIDPEKVDTTDKEQLEDLLVVVLNESLQIAESKQAEASQHLLKDLLPGGMGNLFGL